MRNDNIMNGRGANGREAREGEWWEILAGFCMAIIINVWSIFCLMSANSSKKFKVGIYFGLVTWFILNIK